MVLSLISYMKVQTKKVKKPQTKGCRMICSNYVILRIVRLTRPNMWWISVALDFSIRVRCVWVWGLHPA